MAGKFWIESLAEEAMARADKEGTIVTCRSGQSPSGAKHIGNINDNIRSFFVAKKVKEMGGEARHVQTHDDMDPFRKMPAKLADLDGEWHDASEFDDMSPHIGRPLSSTPDPFGCCDSWAAHFAEVWESGCGALGLETDYFFNSNLYGEGKFDLFIRMALERSELASRIISSFQETKTSEYVPLNVVCENCGKLTGRVTGFDLEEGTVDYVCDERRLAGKYGTGACGGKGTVEWGGGNAKLPWRFEWPAQWLIFKTTLEPFGKDHYQGSWPSGKEIVEKVFDGRPPIPVLYEFFLVDGKKMSTRHGNVYIVQEMLEMMTPAEFLHFYTLRPEKQRDLDITHLYRLVDDYDLTERVYFGEDEADEKEKMNARGRYELATAEVPDSFPLKLSYTFSALLDQSWPEEGREERVEEQLAELGEPSQREIDFALKRLSLAGVWAERHAPPEYTLNLAELNESVVSDEMRQVLGETADALEGGASSEELLNLFRDACKERDIPLRKGFSTAYLLLIGEKKGPRLGSFLRSLDREWVLKRLRLQA